MTEGHKAALAVAALLGLALGVVVHEWHGALVDRAVLDATLKAEHANQADLKSQSELVVRDLKERVAALEQVKAQAVTPAQIVREIPTFLPQTLPAPVTTVTTPAPAGAAPGTPPTITGMQIPAADMRPLFDELITCKECSEKLTGAQMQTSIDEDKITSLTKERDAAVKAAKGGSVWTRVKHSAETIVISAAAGYLIARAGRK
jgi:hypothetical protein